MNCRPLKIGITLLAGINLLPLPGTVRCALAQADDPFAALAEETRPLNTRWQTDYRGILDAGIGWVSEDNFMFGQYNGLYEQGAVLLADIDWRGWRRIHWLVTRATRFF